MPRENRKRGKKHKKQVEEVDHEEKYVAQDSEQQEAGPSWIVPAREDAGVDPNAPFGYVDAEVKAYFRTVDVQIREWQETRPEVEEDADVDPNEDRRLFFVAALTEMSEKEKQLATDPDCSTILERMIHSMDDFVRRVFMDKMTGSFEQLSRHRFASHVCQTLLTVAADTVSRETRGILPPPPESGAQEGELLTLTQLTLDACEEIVPSLSSLVLDPFASHVLRALLLLLAPDVLHSAAHANSGGSSSFALRSKKSAAYKARQGSMKSVFVEGKAEALQTTKSTPKDFRKMALRFVSALREQLGENEVRALAANQVASPVLQMVLELEAAYGKADAPSSITDHVLVGLITLVHESPDAAAPESEYLMTLLRDPTASHLLETLVSRAPTRAFDSLWNTYFVGKLSRLAAHPVANFVVAKAFERANAEQIEAAVQELQSAAGKIVKNGRTGVLRALVDRSATLPDTAQGVMELIATGFDLDSDEDKKLLVPCILRLKPLADYQRAVETASKPTEEHVADDPRYKRRKTDDPLEPKTQGAVLLQSMLKLPPPSVDQILNSLQAIGVEELIQMAHHVTSSRVLDAVLESPTVPHKEKRKFVMTFIGHYHTLVDDRIGSRVGERCWAFADPYLKEKIARSVIPYEHALAGSAFGKFFMRPLALHILQRDPEQWKSMQSNAKLPAPPARVWGAGAHASSAASKGANADAAEPEEGKSQKRKGKGQPQDEIDALFDATLGKRVKKAELASAPPVREEPVAEVVDAKAKKHRSEGEREKGEKSKGKSKKRKEREEGEGGAEDRDLKDVLGAIRAAPKEDKGPKKRRAH
ncbi:ARM repeat-containing protein [Lenzites betulinus]|nr:ARM repeat-containing protein [Lenzites betulinus]